MTKQQLKAMADAVDKYGKSVLEKVDDVETDKDYQQRMACSCIVVGALFAALDAAAEVAEE